MTKALSEVIEVQMAISLEEALSTSVYTSFDIEDELADEEAAEQEANAVTERYRETK